MISHKKYFLIRKIKIFKFKSSFQFQPKVHETSSLAVDVGEMSSAKTESIPQLKEKAFREAKREGFEPAVEEAGSLQDLVQEESQTANKKIEKNKKDDQFLLRERQRGVSYPSFLLKKY